MRWVGENGRAFFFDGPPAWSRSRHTSYSELKKWVQTPRFLRPCVHRHLNRSAFRPSSLIPSPQSRLPNPLGVLTALLTFLASRILRISLPKVYRPAEDRAQLHALANGNFRRRGFAPMRCPSFFVIKPLLTSASIVRFLTCDCLLKN